MCAVCVWMDALCVFIWMNNHIYSLCCAENGNISTGCSFLLFIVPPRE